MEMMLTFKLDIRLVDAWESFQNLIRFIRKYEDVTSKNMLRQMKSTCSKSTIETLKGSLKNIQNSKTIKASE